ncbi:SEC-C domain-containing protein [Patescibacteria group bacterium]|nr:SEC-C domain-containing protein [Patescibacteria group bacterium]
MPRAKEPCPCGSGQLYGSCCGAVEPCDCGSGLPAGECCY